MWIDARGRCVLGHRRLKVIDLSEGGHQPFTFDDGRLCVTFNGEIYNYIELRNRLCDEGVRFRSDLDTEALTAAIATWGLKALQELDGMFAFALYDAESGDCLLAVPRVRRKLLYFVRLSNGAIAFASSSVTSVLAAWSSHKVGLATRLRHVSSNV